MHISKVVVYLYCQSRQRKKRKEMKAVTHNPFVSTLGTIPASCEFPQGYKLLTNGKKYFWQTGYGNIIEVSEQQSFDDFGNVSYKITFP